MLATGCCACFHPHRKQNAPSGTMTPHFLHCILHPPYFGFYRADTNNAKGGNGFQLFPNIGRVQTSCITRRKSGVRVPNSPPKKACRNFCRLFSFRNLKPVPRLELPLVPARTDCSGKGMRIKHTHVFYKLAAKLFPLPGTPSKPGKYNAVHYKKHRPELQKIYVFIEFSRFM